MISDEHTLENIRKSWSTVRYTWEMVRTNIVFGFATGGIQSPAFKDFSYNLTVLFAFSVLEETLLQLRDEGRFLCKSGKLSALMEASQKANTPWVNYALVDEGRNKRNDIAHHRMWLPSSDCLKYVDAIEAELIRWNIVTQQS